MRGAKIILICLIITYLNITGEAYIPVAYVCCQNYSYNDGTLLNGFEDTSNSGIILDDFENMSNWTVGGIGASQQIDTVNFKEGKQGLELISTNGNRAYTDKIINNNFSTTNNFVFWLYVYNLSTLSYVNIYFTSNGSDWSTWFSDGWTGSLQQGWNKLIFNKGDFTSPNGESWDNVMNKTRIAVWPISGNSTNATLDNLRFNMSDDWVAGGTGTSLQADTVNFKEGKQGLKLIAINGNSAYMDLPINNNFATTNNIDIWMYVENSKNLSGMSIYFTSNSTWSTFFTSSLWSGYTTGWNHLVINKHNFINYGGDDWNNTMIKTRLRTFPQTGKNANVTFNSLTTNMSGQRAKIMLTFDDGYKNVSDTALPILSANNQTATAFYITSNVGCGCTDLMMISDLKKLQNAGWDVSSHTVTHPFLGALNNAKLSSELNGSNDFLVQNGFRKSANFLAYPYGNFTDNVISVAKNRYLFARSTSPNIQPHFFPGNDASTYVQWTIGQINTTTIQSVEDQINDTINSRLLAIIVLHEIQTDCSDNTYCITTSDLTTLSNYLASQKANIDVVTYTDYTIPNINRYTPVLNKTTRIYSNGTSNLIDQNMYDEYMTNMTVLPSSDSIDINITSYNQTGGRIKFNESSNNENMQVSYNIGDRIPNQLYSVNIYWNNGTIYQNLNIYANSSGYINYNSTGFGNPRYQEIEVKVIDTSFTVTLPARYTYLRFNATNSTVNNLNPDGQNASQPFFNITNKGNIQQRFSFYLNRTPANIITYTDLSNNFSSGKIQINTSASTIVPSLAPGSSQNIWMIIDSIRAPAMNINNTLTIKSNSTI